MQITRRAVLSAAVSMPVAMAAPRFALTEIAIGDATLTTVSDGHLILPGSFVFDPMPKQELRPILREFQLSDEQLHRECNISLYRDGTNIILFDAGSGTDFTPTVGSLIESLDAVDLSTEDITHVVFTHAHPDHIWGVLDDFDDPLFTEATYMIGRTEWAYWWNPETVNTIDEDSVSFAVGAKRRLEAIEERVVFFDDGDEILPGISALATPGHTAGHMSFQVAHGNTSALIAGDAVSNHHVAFKKPQWNDGSDQDPEQAAQTRKRLLDQLVSEKMILLGFHLPGGGIGRVEATGESYRFIPVDA